MFRSFDQALRSFEMRARALATLIQPEMLPSPMVLYMDVWSVESFSLDNRIAVDWEAMEDPEDPIPWFAINLRLHDDGNDSEIDV